MVKGRVAFFKPSDGYGLIEADDHDDDMFFYMGNIEGPDLGEGQEVEFDVEEVDKGPWAVNVMWF